VFGFRSGPSAVPSHVPAPDRVRELVLYKYDSCPYCRRVQTHIDALGLADQVKLRDTMMEPGVRGDLASATGRTQVPCLFVDGVALFESADINAWLDAYARRGEPLSG
jgi:glutaredoxin 3